VALHLWGGRPVRPGHRRVRFPGRDATAARRVFDRTIATTRNRPTEVVTDQAPTYPIVLDEVLPGAWHRTERYANNHIEADHGRLKARLRPMRGRKQDRSARIIIAGARPRSERPPRPLRARSRSAGEPTGARGLRRVGRSDLMSDGHRGFGIPRHRFVQRCLFDGPAAPPVPDLTRGRRHWQTPLRQRLSPYGLLSATAWYASIIRHARPRWSAARQDSTMVADRREPRRIRLTQHLHVSLRC
jgi:DDE domain